MEGPFKQKNNDETRIVPFSEGQIFSDKAIENFARYENILQRIHKRLMSEGYKFVEGKLVKIETIKF